MATKISYLNLACLPRGNLINNLRDQVVHQVANLLGLSRQRSPRILRGSPLSAPSTKPTPMWSAPAVPQIVSPSALWTRRTSTPQSKITSIWCTKWWLSLFRLLLFDIKNQQLQHIYNEERDELEKSFQEARKILDTRNFKYCVLISFWLCIHLERLELT